MDYFNLKAEYQGLVAYNEKNSRILLYLKDLLNNYFKLKSQALNTIKISFDSLLIEISNNNVQQQNLLNFSTPNSNKKPLEKRQSEILGNIFVKFSIFYRWLL